MHVWTLLTALAVVAPLACAAPPTDGEPGERPPIAREFDLPRDDAGNTIHVRATAANLDAQVLIVINGGPVCLTITPGRWSGLRRRSCRW